jgi:Cdc6-like AAA superfamily ATPase
LLPSEPKIFYGRELEVAAVIKALSQESPRITILGAGGMGKTCLARAVLHHSEITARYEQHRFFIPCDTVSTSVELAGLIGAHIGLKPGKDLTQAVIRHFASSQASFLVLDNLETVWEPIVSRHDVERFLCLLADVSHLALVVSTQCYLLGCL